MNIIKYSNRPCQRSHGELNKWILDQHNSVVNPQDTFYHLGDFTFYKLDQYDFIAELVGKMNGLKHFVHGNHCDARIMRRLLSEGLIASYQHYLELRHNDEFLVLFHYPIYQWNKGHRGSWHLHGHCHGTFTDYTAGGKIIDVGIDAHPKKTPYTFEELKVIMAAKGNAKHHDV